MLGVVWRVTDLMLFDREFLQTQGSMRSLRTVNIPSYRGMILDRNHKPLAISTPVKSVWLDPKHFNLLDSKLPQLADLLQLTEDEIRQRVSSGKNKAFVYLARSLDPHAAQNVVSLNIPGLYLQNEFRRFYPESEVSAHLLGFTNIDDQGQEGIELAYDDWLRGAPGKKSVLKDRLGRFVTEVQALEEARSGNDLVLSIDRRIQYLAYRELQNVVQTFQAGSGSVVVLDAKTGEILAMVNQPSYNPNQRYKYIDESYRNRAVTDVFEPGSVSKAFTIASAMESGKYGTDTVINTSPGKILIDGNVIKDERDYGKITVAQVLQRSSNVGAARVTLALPPEQLLQVLHRFGFGQVTDSGFPGESAGILSYNTNIKPFDLAALAFGYGLAVTPLQLAQAYAVFANGGELQPASLFYRSKPVAGKRVLAANVAQDVLLVLESVVNDGTARRAQVPGYRVAGKTGTSRMVGKSGYDADRHVASFVGIVPVSEPRFVIAVVVNDPREKSYYGGAVAAPAFSRIAAQALKIYEVPPDMVSDNGSDTSFS